MSESIPGASPKSPRYFYTDPLAAAWMAKHFGMMFVTADDGEKFDDFPDYLHWNWDQKHGPIDSDDYLIIHANSLHLLKLQVGDVVQNPDDDVVRVCMDSEPVVMEGWVKHSEARTFVGTAATIIQRNGIAFHWPESEAA